jgi:hypothetical protein
MLALAASVLRSKVLLPLLPCAACALVVPGIGAAFDGSTSLLPAIVLTVADVSWLRSIAEASLTLCLATAAGRGAANACGLLLPSMSSGTAVCPSGCARAVGAASKGAMRAASTCKPSVVAPVNTAVHASLSCNHLEAKLSYFHTNDSWASTGAGVVLKALLKTHENARKRKFEWANICSLCKDAQLPGGVVR